MNDPHVEDIMPTGDCSYAIVCLIMALWEAIKPPFYILDGFDFSAVRAAKSTIQWEIGLGKSFSSCFLLPRN